MGACTFTTKSYGKTAREAFACAVDDARYEYGHGGYTGTIAEKGTFVTIDLEREIPNTIEALEKQRALCKIGEQKRLQKEYEQCEDWEKREKISRNMIRVYNQSLSDACKQRRDRIDRSLKILKAKRKVDMNARVNLIVEHLINSCDHRIDDKWGPAGCIEVGPVKGRRGVKEYVFFGWASS